LWSQTNLGLPAPSQPFSPKTVFFVDAASPGGNGSSWSAAFSDLQDALALAGPGDVIRVAEGTYLPDRGTGDRTLTFDLPAGVRILGGFSGAAGGGRDPAAHPTVLSGNLGLPGSVSDNSFHVVTASGADSGTLFDGFTVTGGNADGTGTDQDIGGGMLVRNASPSLADCLFLDNFAFSQGGGLWCQGSPRLDDCRFTGNQIIFLGQFSGDGGGMYSEGNPVLTDCVFSANETLDLGGGLWSLGDPRLTGCQFLGNLATAHNFQGMGAAFYSNGNPVIQDCLFRDNHANSSGGAVFSIGSPAVDGCRLENNFGGAGGAAAAQGAPVFTNCLFAGNVAVNDIFENNGGAVSCEGTPSFFNCTFTACVAADNGGGIYVFTGTTLLTNNIFWGNSDRSGSGEAAQIFLETGASTQLNFCCVEGLTGVLGGMGNMNEDPRFADELGGDFHLRAVSPCIGSGNGLLPGAPKKDFEGDPRFLVQRADIGYDEFFRHLYVLGDFTPGGAVTIKIVGDPGSSPVVLSVGLGLKAVPLPTPNGDSFLDDLVKEKGLPPIPPSGILVIPVTLPPVPPQSGLFALQALVGDKLTNPFRIDVE